MLSIVGKFNRDIFDLYILIVRVFDNGILNFYFDIVIIIYVIEEGMNLLEVKDLDISISFYDDNFFGGVIG